MRYDNYPCIVTKRRDVLRWLSPVAFEVHHQETKKLRYGDTGGWLFGKKPFEDWVEAESSSIMWLSGKRNSPNSQSWLPAYSDGLAGSGKTVLRFECLLPGCGFNRDEF